MKDPKEIYPRLRDGILKLRRPHTIAAPSKLTEPWGILMDCGVQNGSATVTSMSDGSASVYLSSGGGYVGVKAFHRCERPRKERSRRLGCCRCRSRQPPSFRCLRYTEWPFYLLTDAGVYALRANDAELKSLGYPLGKLWGAMQEVMTQFRLWQAAAKAQADTRGGEKKN